MEWLVPDHEDALAPPDDYVASFVLFHEHGLAVPPHPFFQGLEPQQDLAHRGLHRDV